MGLKPQAAASPAPQPATIAQAGGTASGGNPIRLVSGQLSISPAFEHEVEQAVVSEPVAPPRPGAPVSSSNNGWNKTRIDGSVRQVQATSDPFRDPFGDRYAQRPGPTFTQQPAGPCPPTRAQCLRRQRRPSICLLPACPLLHTAVAGGALGPSPRSVCSRSRTC